jgi:glycosyltransferase involved in cell wall biosynthesis
MVVVDTRLTLADLPAPPPGKTGWPWTEQSQPLPDRRPDGSAWPRISVVTPNFNNAAYIEETIRSVLLQGYPNLEYFMIDGGSTDDSVAIIQKYAPFLTDWVSEPDRGQSHAINKGLAKATGDYVAWMNASDYYFPNAFSNIFATLGRKDLIYSFAPGVQSFSLKYLLRFFYHTKYIVPSQTVFVSQQLLGKVGFLREDLHYCMDLEWFARMALQQPVAYYHPTLNACCQAHADSKTMRHAGKMRAEAIQISREYAPNLAPMERRQLEKLIELSNLFQTAQFQDLTWKDLLQVMQGLPLEGWTDRRFLGLLKHELFKLVGVRSKSSVTES